MTGRKLLDDCFLHDKDRMKHADCLDQIVRQLGTVVGRDHVNVAETAGRFLASVISAPRNVPLHDNAAVDGYAFSHAAHAAENGRFPISLRIAAGDTRSHDLPDGTAARIFTGAVMPRGADTVAMQEDCTLADDGKTVIIPPGLKPGANRRKAGEDVAAGATILHPGTRLRPQDIAALSSFGLASADVFAPVKVAVMSTGTELVEPGQSIAVGQVYDSNRAMLKSLAATLPCTVTDLGILPDDARLIERTIAETARAHDLILTSGGVSRGEEDHIVTAIDRLGKRHIWQIAIKPGRPMSFGQIGDCVFIGLPGNPVAAFVCFLLYVQPAITVLGGGQWQAPPRFPVAAGFTVAKKKADRREYWRGWLETDANGRLSVKKFARDGSGLISGLRQATGLIEIPEEVTAVNEGDLVSFLPFTGFGLPG